MRCARTKKTPKKIKEKSAFSSTDLRKNELGPTNLLCPTTSSSVFGRTRNAKGCLIAGIVIRKSKIG